MTLADFWELIKTGIPLLGIPALFVYQHYKVKGLQDQIESRDEILASVKTLVDMIKPAILKHRTEQYEELLEKDKEIAIKEIQNEMDKVRLKAEQSKKKLIEESNDLVKIIIDSLLLHHPDDRSDVIKRIQNEKLKSVIDSALQKIIEKETKRFRAQESIRAYTPKDSGNLGDIH